MTEQDLGPIERIVEELMDLADRLRRAADPERERIGRVVWPPTEEMGHADALATLFDIADCDLGLTLYDETGNELGDEWVVTFSGTQAYPDSPGQYARKPLRRMLEEELQLYRDDDNEGAAPARLLARLIKAFES